MSGGHMHKNLIVTPLGKNREELMERGTPIFPCAVYQRNTNDFIAGIIPAHWHHELEFFFVMEGTAIVSIIDKTFELKEGEGYFVNADVMHAITSPDVEGCLYQSTVFNSNVVSGAPGSVYDVMYIKPFMKRGLPYYIFNIGDPLREHVFKQFTTFFEADRNKILNYEFVMRESLTQMILALNVHSHDEISTVSTVQQQRMKTMLSWIDENYPHPITIQDVADSAGISIRESQKIFSNLVHLTPVQYITRRRISAAVYLLENTDNTISEISITCGFESSSYFTKKFKEVIGETPKIYRQQFHEKRLG